MQSGMLISGREMVFMVQVFGCCLDYTLALAHAFLFLSTSVLGTCALPSNLPKNTQALHAYHNKLLHVQRNCECNGICKCNVHANI
jgi:hypothetical protein